MRITAIRIYPFDTRSSGGHVLAYADVELEGELLIRGVRILEGDKGGLFIGLPSKKGQQGGYREIVRILDREFHKEFRNAVIAAFEAYGEPGGNPGTPPETSGETPSNSSDLQGK